VLIQIAIPSRTDVVEYQRLQNQVFELIGRINGKFSKKIVNSHRITKTSLGSLDYSPVQFIYNSVKFSELVALYRIADVCLITSARDGMNLVACEYIASQIGKYGVLVLSEFAGCAQSLNGKNIVGNKCPNY
jgi:trehalose-6-phosphate synthase